MLTADSKLNATATGSKDMSQLVRLARQVLVNVGELEVAARQTPQATAGVSDQDRELPAALAEIPLPATFDASRTEEKRAQVLEAIGDLQALLEIPSSSMMDVVSL